MYRDHNQIAITFRCLFAHYKCLYAFRYGLPVLFPQNKCRKKQNTHTHTHRHPLCHDENPNDVVGDGGSDDGNELQQHTNDL